jgi:hypothetical protein
LSLFLDAFLLAILVIDALCSDGAEGRVHFCRKKLPDGQLSAESYAAKVNSIMSFATNALLQFLICIQVFKNKDAGAHMKMIKQVKAMEATGHVNILKTYADALVPRCVFVTSWPVTIISTKRTTAHSTWSASPARRSLSPDATVA